MIKVMGKKTEYINVEISKRDLIEETIKLIEKKNDLVDCHLTDSGEIQRVKFSYHGSDISETVRIANSEDIEAFKVINFLLNCRD